MIRCQTKVLLYWLQVSLRPDCKNLGSGVPSLMAADKPCPQLQPSLVKRQKLSAEIQYLQEYGFEKFCFWKSILEKLWPQCGAKKQCGQKVIKSRLIKKNLDFLLGIHLMVSSPNIYPYCFIVCNIYCHTHYKGGYYN